MKKLFFPSRDECLAYIRELKWGKGKVRCICGEEKRIVRRGKTIKGAQRYQCKACRRYFNDLSGTIFAHSKLGIEQMFYIIYEVGLNGKGKWPYELVSEISLQTGIKSYDDIMNFINKIDKAIDRGEIIV